MKSALASLLMAASTAVAPSASQDTTVPFSFSATVTTAGHAMDIAGGYDVVMTSSVATLDWRYPTLSDAKPALRAVAVAEPVGEIAFIAGLAALALVRRRRGTARVRR